MHHFSLSFGNFNISAITGFSHIITKLFNFIDIISLLFRSMANSHVVHSFCHSFFYDWICSRLLELLQSWNYIYIHLKMLCSIWITNSELALNFWLELSISYIIYHKHCWLSISNLVDDWIIFFSLRVRQNLNVFIFVVTYWIKFFHVLQF